jgi:hypothetical protein
MRLDGNIYAIRMQAPGFGRVHLDVNGETADIIVARALGLVGAPMAAVASEPSPTEPQELTEAPVQPQRKRQANAPVAVMCRLCGEPFMALRQDADVCRKPYCRQTLRMERNTIARNRRASQREEEKQERLQTLVGQADEMLTQEREKVKHALEVDAENTPIDDLEVAAAIYDGLTAEARADKAVRNVVESNLGGVVADHFDATILAGEGLTKGHV